MNKSDLRNYYIDQIKNRDEIIIMLNKELNELKRKMIKYENQMPNVLADKIEGNRVIITCPYCKQTHIHGFSNGDKVIHRGSHCTDADLEKMNLIRNDVINGYEIILTEVSE